MKVKMSCRWPAIKIRKITGVFAFLICTITMLASVASAQEAAKSGFYIAPRVTYVFVEGDFDGESGYEYADSPGTIILVPEIEEDFGYGLMLGSRLEQFAFEISYLRSDHDVEFFGIESDARYTMFNTDLKYYFLPHSRWQPYAGIGVGYHKIRVEDSSFSATSVGDTEYHGWGFNVPLGVAFYPAPRITVFAGVVLRELSFSRIKGLEGEAFGSQKVDANGYYFDAGVSYTF